MFLFVMVDDNNDGADDKCKIYIKSDDKIYIPDLNLSNFQY